MEITVDGITYELIMEFEIEEYGDYAAFAAEDSEEVLLFRYTELDEENVELEPLDEDSEEFEVAGQVFLQLMEMDDDEDFEEDDE